MRVPEYQRKSYVWRWTAALAGLAVLTFALVMALVVTPSTQVRAATVSTLASATLSADTQAAPPGSGVYTSLTGPVIVEAAAGEVTVGTIVLSAPSGFEFRTTGTVTVSVSPTTTAGIKIDTDPLCASADASEPAVLAATTITISVCTVSTTASTITWSGIGVRPTGTGPTAPPFDPDIDATCGPGVLKAFPTGNIILDPASTSTITGIPANTALGHLAETSGAAATITWSTPLGNGSVDTIVGPGTVCVEDQFGSGAVAAPMSWSISSAPVGATCQELVAPDANTNGTGKAFTSLRLGHLDGNYQVSARSGAAGPTTDVSTASGGPGASCAPPTPPTSTPTNTPTPGTPTPTGTPPTSTPTRTSTPIGGATATPTTGPMESVTLVGGACTPVASTYPNGTPVTTIAGAVTPSSALISVWAFQGGNWLGYSPQFPQASQTFNVDRLGVAFICVSSAANFSRPKI